MATDGRGASRPLAGFAIFLLFAYALSWGCACLGIVSKGPESAQGIGLVILFPLAIVSNALVPTEHMPAVLRAVADWNPVSAVTAAARTLWHNPNPSASIHAWPMQHPVEASLLWCARSSWCSPRWPPSSTGGAQPDRATVVTDYQLSLADY